MVRADYVKEMIKRDIQEKKYVKRILYIISIMGFLLFGTMVFLGREIYINRGETRINRSIEMRVDKKLDIFKIELKRDLDSIKNNLKN